MRVNSKNHSLDIVLPALRPPLVTSPETICTTPTAKTTTCYTV